MFKYKYLLTMLAMVFLNLGVTNLVNNVLNTAAVYFLLGTLFFVVKAAVIVVKQQSLWEQLTQWVIEVSLFLFVIAYNIIATHLIAGVILYVGAVVGCLAFVALVMCHEMSKIIASID